MVQHPEVLWAQRSSSSVAEKAVNLPDIKESSLEYTLKSTTISFKAKAGVDPNLKEYAFDLELYHEVDPEKSEKILSTRSLYLTIFKKERQSEYWPRLTKEKVKNAFLKTDFSKWVDEDEQDGVIAEESSDMGGMGEMGGMGGMGGGMGGGMDFEKMMAQMGGMGGMGGMEGMEGLGGPGGMGESSSAVTGDEDSDDDGPPPLEDAEPAK